MAPGGWRCLMDLLGSSCESPGVGTRLNDERRKGSALFNSSAYPFPVHITGQAHTFSASGRLGAQSGEGEIGLPSWDPSGRVRDKTVNAQV